MQPCNSANKAMLLSSTFEILTMPVAIHCTQASSIPNLWQPATIPPALANTPPFFQHLLSSPLTESQCDAIATEITENHLAICSDGAHDASNQIASHGIVFGSSLLKQTIATASGPVDGHPRVVTSYRAERSGIVATLYLLYRVCLFYNITMGTAKLYCDNKGALKNAFSPIKEGITPYFNTDHDLVEVAQALLKLLPIALSNEWVKGHYNGNQRQYQHDLNAEADTIAGHYQAHQYPHYSIRKPIPPPDFRVRLLHDSSVITSRIHSVLQTDFHDTPIVDHILRKTGWSKQVFSLVHWDSHERAFRRLSRGRQCSTAKLLHQLANTNKQNHLYYSHSSLCPICHQEEETFQHVLTCHQAGDARHAALEDLVKTLHAIQTPDTVIDALEYGFSQWLSNTDPSRVRALTAGSLRGPDAVLTSAFLEQFRDIGWYHLCLGRVSRKWAAAVMQYNSPSQHRYGGLNWSSLFITGLWQFTRALWTHRNEVVHGATVEEQATRQIAELRNRITTMYNRMKQTQLLFCLDIITYLPPRLLQSVSMAPMTLWWLGSSQFKRPYQCYNTKIYCTEKPPVTFSNHYPI
jgi:hypothetical protein